jgi:ATP-dependent Clp protease ATP-binding subunit ClpB
VFNVLLQILDDGRLTDGQGHVVDFTQTLVLMTSNLRTEADVKRHFRPEFVNRLDEVLVYKALERAQVHAIVDVQLARLAKRMAEQDLTLELTPAAKDALAEEGWDPEYGARPLKRAIQRRLENKLAESILSQKLLPGDTALFDFGEDGWKLEPRRASQPVEA